MAEETGSNFTDFDDEFTRQYNKVAYALRHAEIFEALNLITDLRIKFPDSTSVQELYGDVLFDQCSYKEALQAYRKALELEPANIDAERKIAQVIFQLNKRNFQPGQRVKKPISLTRSRQKAKYAMTASILVPGIGQIYNGENLKGILMLLLYFPLLGWASWGVISLYLDMVCLYRYFYSYLAPKLILTFSDEMFYMLAIASYLSLVVFSAWDAYHRSADCQKIM